MQAPPPAAAPPPVRSAAAPPRGQRLVLAAALLAAGEAALLAGQALQPALLAMIRLTAQTSLLWFALTFAASPLTGLWPGPASKWLLRNRRYLGLAMAVSHGVHLLAIVALAWLQGAAFWRPLALTTIGGGALGYVLLGAMVITSTDGSVARLGRRRWRWLHGAGMWSFWGIFLFTYAPIASRPFPAFATALMLTLAGARAVVAQRRRRKPARRAAA